LSWTGTNHEPQAVYAEDNPVYGGKVGNRFHAFPCGHEIQHRPVRLFLHEPVTPIGAAFARYRSEPLLSVDDFDRELCPECLGSQLEAGRAVLVEA
jgi:hypothetical protein